MRYLLDTNVLSEVRRLKPHAGVLQWLDQIDEDRVYISVITLAEIRRGVILMEAGRRRNALASWLSHDLPQRFEHRILPIDDMIAVCWGDMMAASKRRGFALTVLDGFLAATANVHALTLVTRNIKDFDGLGVRLFDPWAEEQE